MHFSLSEVLSVWVSLDVFLVTRAHAAPAAASTGSAFLGLSLQNFTPYHALAGGLLLGVAAAMSMIVKGENGKIFGGCTDIPWMSDVSALRRHEGNSFIFVSNKSVSEGGPRRA